MPPLPRTSTASRTTTAYSSPQKLQNFGININNTNWGRKNQPLPPEALEALDRSGAGWVRANLAWAAVQPEPGQPYDWSDLDQFVAALRARRINILFDLRVAPCWARADQSLPCDGQDWRAYAPRTDLWRKFVADAVRHYKGQVTYWEIWNEPNYPAFLYMPEAPNNDDARFVKYRDEIFIPAAAAIHSADPNAKVVGPAIGGAATRWSPGEFGRHLELSLDNGAGRMVDVVDMHLYPPGELMAYGRAARQAMADLGIADRPLWLTETGAESSYSRSEMDESFSGTPPEQYLTDIFRNNFGQSHPVFDKIFWFSLIDGKAHNFGLLNEDWSPRPVYKTLQGLAAQTH